MHYRQLGATTLKTSVIGFGASPFGDVFGKTDPRENKRALDQAINAGINFFDTSPYYGLTLAETRLGDALQSRRSEVLLSTKCGRYGATEFDFSAKRITVSVEESLKRLRTDHLDLLLAHDVEFEDADLIVEETIPAMRALQAAGKTRYIGISAYPLHTLRSIAERVPVDVVLSYCHYNPLNTLLEDEGLIEFARARGIGLINASPLHMGLLNGRMPPPWHPAPAAVREAAARFVALCRRKGLEPATVALRFCLESPQIATTLIGMATAEEVNDNLKALEEETNPELRREIAEIAAPVAGMTWPSGKAAQKKETKA